MNFIGRKEELYKLNSIINLDSFNMGLIYGRRRVGKSELVKEALNQTKVKSLYYECKQVTEESTTKDICGLISELFNLPTLGYTKLEEVLEFIFKKSIDEKYILVLDEYSYLKDNVKGIDSIVQSLVDKYKEKSKLTLIILGSYVEIMKSLLETSNPLYGRIDLIINLKSMNYYESSLFYPSFSNEDKVKLYSVFGGIPYYNKLIDENKTVKENIIDLISAPEARLDNEVSTYLKSEISKIVNANEVFDALSKGFSKYNDILSQSNVTSGPTLIDVLDKLVKMEVVVKKSPINDETNKRKSGYYICDNLSMFYYRYIFRHLSQRRIMSPEVFYNKYIEKDFETEFVPHQFEEIAMQYLINQNKQGFIDPVLEKIGKYYYDDPKNKLNGEFDVVSLDEKGYVFYEVKFKKHTLSEKEVKLGIDQVKNTNLFCYKYVFVTKSGIAYNGSENVAEILLDEMYK